MEEEPVIKAIIFSSFFFEKKIKSTHKYQAEVMKKRNIKICLLEIPGLFIKAKHTHTFRQIEKFTYNGGKNQETF